MLLPTIALAAALFTLPQAYASSYKAFLVERLGAGRFLAGIIPVVNALIGKRIAQADRSRAFGKTTNNTNHNTNKNPKNGGVIGAHFGLGSVFLLCGVLLCAVAAYARVVL